MQTQPSTIPQNRTSQGHITIKSDSTTATAGGWTSEEDTEERLIKLGEHIKWEFCLNPIDDDSGNEAQAVVSSENNAKIEKFVQNLFRVVKYVHDACSHLSKRLSVISKDNPNQRGVFTILLRVLYIIYELDIVSMKKSDSITKILQAYRTLRKQQQQQQQHTWTSSNVVTPTPLRADSMPRTRGRIGIGATRAATSAQSAEEPTKWAAVKAPICVNGTHTSPQLSPPTGPQQQQFQMKTRQSFLGQRPARPPSTSPNTAPKLTSPHTQQIAPPTSPLSPSSQSQSQLQQFQQSQQMPPLMHLSQGPPPPQPPQPPTSPKSPPSKHQEAEGEDKGMPELDKLAEWFSAKYPGMCYARVLFPAKSCVLSGFIQFCLNVLGDRVVGFSEGFRSHLAYVRGLTFGFFYLFTADCAQDREELGILGTQAGFQMPPESTAMGLWTRAEPWISSIPFTPVCEGRYYECTTALFDDVPPMNGLGLNTSTTVARFKSNIHQLLAEAVLPSESDFTAFLGGVTNILQDINNPKRVADKFKEIILFLTKVIELIVLLKTTLMAYSTNISAARKKNSESDLFKSDWGENEDYITNYDKEEDHKWEKLFGAEVSDFVLRVLKDVSTLNRAFEKKDVRLTLEEASLACRKKLGAVIRAMTGASDAYKYMLGSAFQSGAYAADAGTTPSDAVLTKAATMLVDYTATAPSAASISGFDQAAQDYFLALYGLTRICPIMDSITDLSIVWFIQESQYVRHGRFFTKHSQAKPVVWTDRIKSTFNADSGPSPVPMRSKKLSLRDQQLSQQVPPLQLQPQPQEAVSTTGTGTSTNTSTSADLTSSAGSGSTTPTRIMSPPSSSSLSSSSSSSSGQLNASGTPQDGVRGVQLGQEIVKYLDDIKEPWCQLPIIKFAPPPGDGGERMWDPPEGILSDRDFYEKEDLERIKENVKLKKGTSFANFLTVRLMNKILDEGKDRTAKLANIEGIYRRVQHYYVTYGNNEENAATEDNAERKQRLFRSLCRRLVDAARALFAPLLEEHKKAGGDDPTASVEFFLSCDPSFPVWFPRTYEGVFLDINITQFLAFVGHFAERRFRRLVEGINSALCAEASEQEFWRHMDTYMLEQLSTTLVLDFSGCTAERSARLESPLTVFSHNNKPKIARRLLAAMLANRLHAERVALSASVSRSLITLLQIAVVENPELVYARDVCQNSLLHWASWLQLDGTCNEELFRFLVKRGCSLEARNSAGETPFLSSRTSWNAATLARLGARTSAATVDGLGIADLHPDWVPKVLEALRVGALPEKEQVTVLDVAVSSASVPDYVLIGEPGKDGQEGSNSSSNACVCKPNVSLATRFVIAAANRTAHAKLLSGRTVYSWLYGDCEAISAAGGSQGGGASKAERKKKKGPTETLRAEKKFPRECWPLVALDKVEGTAPGKTVLARVGVSDRMSDEELLSWPVLLLLYDVSKVESLDEKKIQADIARSQAISKFLVGVGSETRSDRASILKYWEQHVLPIRIEDATRVGRKFGIKGIGECATGGDDIYSMLCAVADTHFYRLYRDKGLYGDDGKDGEDDTSSLGLAKTATGRKDRTRIARLIPMLPSDACYDSVKMLVLGHEEAGKTSLLDSISEKHSWKTFSKAIWKKRSAQTMSTIGIKRVPLTIGEVPVNAYDFGGQLEYHAIHEYFLSPYCAMYLVVVDGSKERLTEQLGYWLQLLHSHSKGPRGSCALIVVCTKADVIEKRFCADAVVAKRAFLKDYLSHWPSLNKIAAADVFMVSNKTGYGIKALQDAIKERLRALAKTPVPQLYLSAAQVFARSPVSFLSFREFVQFMVDNKILTQKMPPKHSQQLARDILDFLHNSGHAVVSSGYDTICCRPEMMSNVLSIFVAPPDHLKRLLDTEGIQRMEILTRPELVRRLMHLEAMKGARNPERLCDKVISSLEDMKFCYALRPEEARLAYNLGPIAEQCYIFPSLCDTVDFVALPYNEAADRGPYVFHMTCHGYECAGCRSRYTAPRWEPVPPAGVFCPKCGCPEIAHVCLNEPLGPVAAFGGRNHQEVRSEYLAVVQEESTNYAWACLANDARGVQKVSVQRPCQCVEFITPAVKYVACIVDSMLEQGVSVSEFDRVAVQLRRYMHPRYRLFRNFVVFRDIFGNVVLVTLFTKDRQRALGIISRGTVPHLWVESLHPLLTLGEAVVPACPACAHFNTFTPLQKASSAGPNAGIMTCSNGHTVPSEQVYTGMPRNERLCAESALWGPKKSVAFYEESAKKWLTDPRYPNATFTELTAGDTTPARQSEYIFARSLFYKFVGTDPASSQFTLTKVVFVENKATEALFARKFGEFAARVYSGSQSGCGGDDTAAAGSDANTKKPSADKVEWQQWVLAHLRKCVERVCGNEQINLVGGWHGTIDRSAHGIANTNFYMPAENKASKDPGYFGKGVYFTQSPAYGVDYAVLSANITKQHAKEAASGGKSENGSGNGGEPSYSEEELTPCLVFSWILLGHVYPVTEAADSGADSLMGKGCVEGYDSHYVVLPQQQGALKNAAILRPYNPNALLEKPGCDEIVVFDKAQILPRYIFYYNKLSNAKDGFLPLEVRDARTVVLWVDDEINTHEMVVLQTYAKKAIPEVAIVPMVSSSELKAWLHQFGQEVEDKIVVVTNFFRANDGENNAAWRVINEVRKVAKLKKVPILVHSKNSGEDVQNFSKMKLVFTACDNSVVVSFIKQKKI